jgi:tetratricopeptide (TPR) repeat protein
LLVLILSSHSNNSAHVKREVQNACREEPQIPVLPFQVENISLNKALRYYIGSAQWLSALTPPLETHLQKLVAYVEARLPQHEEEKGKQNGQSAKPEVRAVGDKRRRALESNIRYQIAKDDAQRAAARRKREAARTRKAWIGYILTLILVGLVSLGVLITSKWLLRGTTEPPANQNSMPAGTQQSDQKTNVPLTAAENAERGNASFSLKSYAEAEPYYREAVRLEPGNAEYNNNLGNALSSQRRYAEAKAYYLKAAQLDPNNPTYQHNLKRVSKQ